MKNIDYNEMEEYENNVGVKTLNKIYFNIIQNTIIYIKLTFKFSKKRLEKKDNVIKAPI